jgi:hypothetical protein
LGGPARDGQQRIEDSKGNGPGDCIAGSGALVDRQIVFDHQFGRGGRVHPDA